MSHHGFNDGCRQANLCTVHYGEQQHQAAEAAHKRFGRFHCRVSAHPCRDVRSQLRRGRLLQEGAVRSKPRGVLVRRPARRGTDGLQDPWQPGLRYDLEKFALNLNLKA